MKQIKFRFMDPNEIIAVIVVLIVLGIGVYAFFVTSSSLVKSRETPRGNYGTLSTNRTIRTTQANPTFINVSSTFGNVTTAVQLEAWNTSSKSWVVIQAVGAANGTFIHNNLTYRVVKRSVAGEIWWHYYRLTYSTNSSYTSTNVNQTYKSLQNSSQTGGTVFNILGICITISAIMGIIGVIYAYMRPK